MSYSKRPLSKALSAALLALSASLAACVINADTYEYERIDEFCGSSGGLPRCDDDRDGDGFDDDTWCDEDDEGRRCYTSDDRGCDGDSTHTTIRVYECRD